MQKIGSFNADPVGALLTSLIRSEPLIVAGLISFTIKYPHQLYEQHFHSYWLRQELFVNVIMWQYWSAVISQFVQFGPFWYFLDHLAQLAIFW